MSCSDVPENKYTFNGAAKTYGIIGDPVSHSLSPVMHNAAFVALGLNCVYIPLPVKDLEQGVAGLQALGFKGVSVTIPHKQEVMQFVDVLDPVAERIGAVNTLVFGSAEDDKDKSVYGYNTDWMGANRALQEKTELQGSRVLVLGAGGSARAIGYGLLEAGAEIVLANRTAEKGERLAGLLQCDFCPLAELSGVKADILVNTTSVGMKPNAEVTPVSQDLLEKFSVVMDIVYAPLETRLLKEARAKGCTVIDGLAMLLYQGVAQFELWTGMGAPVAVMKEVLHERIK